MLYFEHKFKSQGFEYIVGVDEVGRGPLAGPVVAGAVLLKGQSFKNRIIDSKKLTSKRREEAFFEIINKSIYGIGIVSEKIIDSLNIVEATRLAMEKAIHGLVGKLKIANSPCADFKNKLYIIVDGRVKLNTEYPYTSIIKGDNSSKSIAAASIFAKVVRDRIMSVYSKTYPEYGFLDNKGYPTSSHRIALKKYGPTEIHRRTFIKKIV